MNDLLEQIETLEAKVDFLKRDNERLKAANASFGPQLERIIKERDDAWDALGAANKAPE